MKKYNFIYLTTNLINGKQYVGVHETNDIDDGYLGTGKLIKSAIKKYTKSNFHRDIIEMLDTKLDCMKHENEWIEDLQTKLPNGYNIVNGGGGRAEYRRNSEEIKEKIRQTLLNKSPKEKERAKKINSDWHRGKTPWNKGTKGRQVAWNKGISNTEEQKLKHSIYMTGRPAWNKGLKTPEEIKKKISISTKIGMKKAGYKMK